MMNTTVATPNTTPTTIIYHPTVCIPILEKLRLCGDSI